MKHITVDAGGGGIGFDFLGRAFGKAVRANAEHSVRRGFDSGPDSKFIRHARTLRFGRAAR